jgi:hypothetical protein
MNIVMINDIRKLIFTRVCMGICLAGVTFPAPLAEAQDATGRIRPYSGNPFYWEYKGEPVMLLGGTWQDNLFNHPLGLEDHLDRLVEVGGNYIRNTMSSRNQGNAWAFAQVGVGRYDLDSWNEEYWDRLTHLLELTRARDIIVQVELWDPHDHFRDHQTQGGWSFHPFNPENNVNYTAEQSNLPTVVDYHPRATPGNHGFFRTVPDLDNNALVLGYQQRYVDRLLSITLEYPHVLYCINNETGEDPEWGDYWLRYIRERARRAAREIYTTDMRRRNDITADDHAFIYRNPDRYTFVDISQNNSQVISPGQLHWDRIMAVRGMLKELGPRPINNVKVYSREDGEHVDGPQRFWRIVFAGCASVRFHRPHPYEGGPEHHYVRSHGGLGLHHQAQLNIRSARMLTEAMNVFSAEPRNDLLAEREENEAYCLARPGEAYAVYFPAGGAVVLEAATAGNGYEARWLAIDETRWLQPIIIKGAGSIALKAPDERPWVVVLTRR